MDSQFHVTCPYCGEEVEIYSRARDQGTLIQDSRCAAILAVAHFDRRGRAIRRGNEATDPSDKRDTTLHWYFVCGILDLGCNEAWLADSRANRWRRSSKASRIRGLIKPPLPTADVAAAERSARRWRLARTRAQADLKSATVAAHRTMLGQAIADLDRRIAALDK